MRRSLASVLLAGALPFVASGATGQAAARLRFDPPPPGSYQLPAIHRVAGHRLLDPEGQLRPILDLAPGEVALVSFIYLSCGHACPRTTALLQRLDRRLAAQPEIGSRVQLVTVSFDPGRDTPQAMGRLRRALAPRSRWSFLTARDSSALQPVLRDWGQDLAPQLARAGDPTGQLQHVLRVFLVDDAGAIREVYSTGFLDLGILWNDLLTLLHAGP